MRLSRILCITISLALLALGGCQTGAGPSAEQVNTQLADAHKSALDAIAQLEASRTQLRATTQPTATAKAIEEEAAAEKTLDKSVAAIKAADAKGQQIAPVIIAVATGQDPGPAIIGASPIAGPYAPWVALAGIGVSAVWGLMQKAKAAKTLAAGQTAVDAIQAAIADGRITVKPGTDDAVDAIANSHPTNDRLVDVLEKAAAPK